MQESDKMNMTKSSDRSCASHRQIQDNCPGSQGHNKYGLSLYSFLICINKPVEKLY